MKIDKSKFSKKKKKKHTKKNINTKPNRCPLKEYRRTDWDSMWLIAKDCQQ